MQAYYNSSSLCLWLFVLQYCSILVTSQTVQITDATANFQASTESTFDHMIELEDNLFFHWNDIVGDSFTGRLIQRADSIDQAPSWLAFGVYHSNHNYTTLPTEQFMVGSTAIIGLVTAAEASTPAQHYYLGGQTVEGISIASSDTSYTNAAVVQHDSDNGSVVTDLSFTKSLVGSTTEQGNLRREGTNVFLWAVGPPEGVSLVLGKHSAKGVMYLDLAAVRQQIENPSSSSTTPPPSDNTVPSGGGSSNVVNTAPIIRGNCGSTVFSGNDAGQVALTPTITFHWKIVEKGTKIQVALEHAGEESWLAIAASPNGKMIGSSAVIGSPGDDSLGITPVHYSLTDESLAGVVLDPSVQIESATITSALSVADPSQTVTTLMYTRALDDPNDSVPITSGLTTFLYAVGASRELAYHEHRGAFQLNVEECGGTISTGTAVWTRHGMFAAHGFLATLAWALATPFAVTVAWFRTLVPASWIYIHVFANVFSFLGTLLAFIIVVLGISGVNGASHFNKTHHWVGLVLLCLATFQFINGFLRPPVQRKDNNRTEFPQDSFLGIIPIPRNPRETWQLMHRSSGLAAIAMGIYQIQSGLGLYSQRFQTQSMVMYYWIYVGVFFGSLVALKVWVYYEEEKARQGVMQAVSTTEPSAMEERQNEGPPSLAPVVLDGTLS